MFVVYEYFCFFHLLLRLFFMYVLLIVHLRVETTLAGQFSISMYQFDLVFVYFLLFVFVFYGFQTKIRYARHGRHSGDMLQTGCLLWLLLPASQPASPLLSMCCMESISKASKQPGNLLLKLQLFRLRLARQRRQRKANQEGIVV